MESTNAKHLITLRDRLRTEHCTASSEVLELVLAGLSGDGETIEEFWGGVKRFQEGHDAELQKLVWLEGVAAAGAAAEGWILIDLPARVIVGNKVVAVRKTMGRVNIWSEALLRYVEVPYRWSGRWKWVTGDIEGIKDGWGELIERRRRQRWQGLVTDVRAVLFGRDCSEFVVAATRQLRRDRKETGKAEEESLYRVGVDEESVTDVAEQLGVDRGVYGETGEVYSAREYALVRDLHAQWLLTTRHDLQGRTPRDVLLEERDRLAGDVEDRRQQWVMTGVCPSPISQATYAYRYGGVGPQEGVMHQRMMRYLLERVWFEEVDPWGERKEGFSLRFSEAVERVETIKQEWLSRVQAEELDGYSPLAVIDLERQRIPMVSESDHGEPLFVMLSPWRDEEEFVFSECRLYEDWRRRADRGTETEDREGFAPQPMRDAIWENSYVVPEVNQMSPSVRVFTGFLGFASHIQELGQNLRENRCDANLALPLAEHLEALKDVCRDHATWRIDAVVEEFCDSLEQLERHAPTLRPKCRNFQQRLRAFAEDALRFMNP